VPTPEEIKEDFAIKAVEWVKSPEGRKAIEESLRKTREAQELLEKAHRVNPDDLKIPFTI
jgi:hypothetical protein